nr:ATP-binding protein [Vibrio sp. 624788]
MNLLLKFTMTAKALKLSIGLICLILFTVLMPLGTGKTGHGLGLAIVKQVCDRHQAHVTVGESYMDGACFALSFPRLEP